MLEIPKTAGGLFRAFGSALEGVLDEVCRVDVDAALNSIGINISSKNYAKGAKLDVIKKLAVSVYNEEEHISEDQQKCIICITEYENGERVITLPCFHRFHE